MSGLLTDDVIKVLSPPSEGAIFVVGVGNTLRFDDGVGSYIVSRLINAENGLHVFDAGQRPERAIDKAVALMPARTIILDAADFNGDPGEARIISDDMIPQVVFSTHSFPLGAVSRFIEQDTGSPVYFIGIQAQSMSYDEGLSDPVKKTADLIVKHLLQLPV
ncbi:MAG: hydrogenase 3 maturation endopeptidase HyCI [Dissulfurispiraceae bacterium]|jgi:hydrogenase 3 maturation protease|nr:hydrogenase 3 maturation endopeptidase HyCI [Dissulfurispiraceae bacterium]